MKNKIKTFSFISLISVVLLLSSCEFTFPISENNQGGNSNTGDNTYKSFTNRDLKEVAKFASTYAGGEDIREKFNAQYTKCMPSKGRSKMLVVPVLLKGEYLPVKDELTRERMTDNEVRTSIYNSFFGTSENTGWESVSSFYYKSSYGQLDIQGEVTSIFNTNVALNTLKQATNENCTNYTNSILESIYDYYFTNGTYNYSDYDSNNDGLIDSVYMVYLSKHNSSSPALWAYTYWDANSSYSHISAYSWSSYDFMVSGTGNGYTYSFDNKVDSHTYIHETGHLLSLDDYYDTNGITTPAGGVDMMDNNVTDHDAFTKYALGWTNPKLVTSETDLSTELSITLNPTESSGDSIVVANNFNGTSFDEYLMIEFYTPTGLNKQDSKYKYKGSYPKGFSSSGVRISHVDQRLGKFIYSNNGFSWSKSFCTGVPNLEYSNKSFYNVVASNSSDYSYSNFDLIQIMDASAVAGSSTTKFANSNKYFADDSTLFGTDSSFTNIYSAFKFNSGAEVPCNITITSVSSTSATITFSAK